MNMKKRAVGALAAGALAIGGLLVATPAQATIHLWEHDNYTGKSFNAGSGYRSSLPGFNDKTSSLKVTNGDTATLYEQEAYRGCKKLFQSGSSSLKTWRLCDTPYNWNDRASGVY